MRNLTDIEYQAIKSAIVRKEISSAEILMEVYDHYVSHLQELGEVDFDDQLAELEEKFTYGYCHSLQANLQKNLRKDISKRQWLIIKNSFCFSKLIYSLGLLLILFTFSMNLRSEDQYFLMMYVPIILLAIFSIFVLFNRRKRTRIAKSIFAEQKDTIKSYLSEVMVLRITLPVLILNGLLQMSKIFLKIHEIPFAFLPQTMGLMFHGISLFEVWKVKSKTSLI
jgi:ABC-type multidrug transport system fused ATPase/permease subunit